MASGVYKRKEKSAYKQVYKVECWSCGYRYSNALKNCPNCKTENEDYVGFNNPDYPQKDEENF